MRTCTTWFAALIIAGVSVSLCNAVEVSAAAADAGVASHTVVKGDTLWGLSAKYYGTPWVWDRLWQANRAQNPDPNRIYPGQQLTVPEKSALPAAAPSAAASAPAPEPAPQQAAVTAPAPAAQPEPGLMEPAAETPVTASAEEVVPAPAVEPVMPETVEAVEPQAGTPEPAAPAAAPSAASKKYLAGESLIVPFDWEIDGFIIDEKDKKMMISAGDTVYVKIEGARVKPGQQLAVYRRLKRVRDPEKRSSSLGYEVRRVGRLEITTDIGEQSSTAKVIMSSDPIEKGDAVKMEQ